MKSSLLCCIATVALLVGSSGCSNPPEKKDSLSEFLGYYFPGRSDAVSRGRELVQSIESEHEGGVGDYIGSTVCYLGTGAGSGEDLSIHPATDLRSGSYWGTLVIHTNVTVDVRVTRKGTDPRPQAAGWGAALLGTVQSVDMQRKSVLVELDVENWKVTEAW